MKKIITVFLVTVIFISTMVVCYAKETQNNNWFLSSDDSSILFLTAESSPADIEEVEFGDKDGNMIDKNRNVYTGCFAQPEGESNQYQVVLTGDVNGDGTVNASDARLAIRAAARTEPLNDYLLFVAADTDCSGKITANDARKILRVSARLDTFGDFEECLKNTSKEDSSAEIDKSTVFAVVKNEYVDRQDECKEYFADSVCIENIVVFGTIDGEVGFEFTLTDLGMENYDETVELIKNSSFFDLIVYSE